MKKVYALILLSLSFSLLSLPNALQAQRMLGMMHDNYAGASSLYYQPANSVDSRFKFDMEFMGMGMYAANDFMSLNRNALRDVIKDPNVFTDTSFYYNYINPDFNGKNKNMFMETDIRLFSTLIPINEKNAFGFGMRFRTIFNVSNMDEDALALFFSKNADPIRIGQEVTYDDANQRMFVFTEYDFNYARVIMDNKQHFLKGGANLKLLQGIAAFYIHEKNLSYSISPDDFAIGVDADIKMGFSADVEKLKNDLANFRFISKPSFGLDLGFVYEWRPDWKEYKYDMDGETNLWRNDLNKYKLKVSASLLDLGQVKFEKHFGLNDVSIHEDSIDFSNWEGANILDSINLYYGVANAENDFAMRLPTSLNFSVDYHVVKGFYTTLSGRLAFNQGSRHYAQVNVLHNITLTPRYETKYLGVYIPLQYSQVSGFNLGLGARVGPFFAGSSDLLSLLGAQKEINKVGFYFGFKIPILYHAPKDKDHDNVSDKMDECPSEPGLWKFQGCPDSDGDGIPNRNDTCPSIAGPQKFNGCPDTDDDGIEDRKDDCPSIAGPQKFNGCPDTDDDGIIDKLDSCVYVAGIPEFHGCPDTDGDKIEDRFDDCPNEAGIPEFNGCPDTDKDGIQDAYDKCPLVPGLDSLQGCPFIDTDGDGLRDERDKCPTLAGPIENQGCPYADTDKDGVPDKDDMCPLTPGPESNFGCPVIEEEEQEILNTAFSNLEFETAKAKIKSSSFSSLDELASLMEEKPEFKLLIEGHTDNVGRDAANMYLSQQRALAVKDYLVSKGIDENRIEAKWYGETKPIADNDTEEGRQKNRRVEMTVVFD